MGIALKKNIVQVNMGTGMWPPISLFVVTVTAIVLAEACDWVPNTDYKGNDISSYCTGDSCEPDDGTEDDPLTYTGLERHRWPGQPSDPPEKMTEEDCCQACQKQRDECKAAGQMPCCIQGDDGKTRCYSNSCAAMVFEDVTGEGGYSGENCYLKTCAAADAGTVPRMERSLWSTAVLPSEI